MQRYTELATELVGIYVTPPALALRDQLSRRTLLENIAPNITPKE